MSWPTSQDYNEAVQDPATSFSDPALKGGEVVVNALGLPVPRSGNFADVYQFTDAAGKSWALKCFTRKVAGLRERYVKIDEHLAKARLPFTVGFKFLQEGVLIHGEWYPLLKMEWVEGFTLNDFVAKNLDKPHHLHALMQMWAKLAGRLRDANMAHADLQHGNVLLVPGATPQKLGLKLIDYDGMWVPALAENPPGEVGHPNFQHPLRLKDRQYNGEVDRFPHLVIAAALRATLIGGQGLWDKFDNGDNLLFKESDLRNPASGPVFKALWELNDPVLRTLVGHIALSAKQPLRKTPWLDDVLFETGGPKLTAEQERQVCDLLGVTTAAPAGAKAAPPAAVEQEFNVFQFLDEDAGPTPAAEKSGMNRRPAQRRTPPKKSKAPFLIGGGIAAALLVAVAVVALATGGKKGSPPEVALHKDDGQKIVDHGPPAVNREPTDPPKDPKSGVVPVGPAPSGVEADREGLKRALADTKWNWGDAILELKGDGTTNHSVWDQRFNLTTRWEALDRRTAVLIVEKGRKNNLYAILEFSEDLASLSGFDYGAAQRMRPKQRVGPLSKRAADAPPTETKQELEQSLAGSEWDWNGAKLKLNGDGSAELPQTEGGPESVTRWEAIDRRTALLTIEKGRNSDRMAILQFSEDVRELAGYDFDNAARLPARKRLDAGAARPPVGSPKSPVIGVSAIPGTHEYLFIRRNDPVLYITRDGMAQKARQLGKLGSVIVTVTAATGKPLVVTGNQLGEVAIWSLEGPRAAATPGLKPSDMKRRISSTPRIQDLKNKWGCDSFDEGVVIREVATGRDEVVAAGKPGHPVTAGFKDNLDRHDRLPELLGDALTGEVKLFDGRIVVQVFAGGVQLYDPDVNHMWFIYHERRKPATGPVDAGITATHVNFKAHTAPVIACAFTEDGTRAVTIGKDHFVCVWDLSRPRLESKFELPGACSVERTFDNHEFLIGTENASVGIWDVDTQKRTKELPGHSVPVRAICVSPNMDWAWTGDESGQIRIWKLPEFTYSGSVFPDKQGISVLALSADRRILAAAGSEGTVRLLNPKTGATIGSHAGKTAVYSLAFLNNGADLVVAREPEPLLIHLNRPGSGASPAPPPTGGEILKMVQEVESALDQPVQMGYGPDGKHYWLAARDAIVVGDGTTGKELKTLRPQGSFGNAALGPGTDIYLGLSGGKFQLWDWEKGEMRQEYDAAAQRGLLAVRFWPLPGPNRLLVTTNTPILLVWDVTQWKEVERLTPYPGEIVTRTAPYPDGNRFAAIVGTQDARRVVVWDVAARREVLRPEPVEIKNLFRLEVSPGGRWIVGFANDGGGQVIVWDGRTGKHAHTIPGVRSGSFGGGFSPGGDHYVYCERAARRWDINLADGKLTDESRGQVICLAAAAAPAAGLFASADTDRKVRIWKFDIDTKPVETVGMPGPKTPGPTTTPAEKEGFLKDSAALSDTVSACVVSSDGKKIFAATHKGVVHVLDAATAEESAKLEVSKVKLVHMVLSPKYTQSSNGVTIPDRLYILDDDRHLHTWESDKATKIRDVNLERSGLPAVSAATRLVIAPNESHLMVFDPDRPEGNSWVPGRWSTTAIPPALQRPPFNTRTSCVTYSADGSVGAAFASRKLVVWRQRAAKDIRMIDTTMNAAWIGLALDAGVVVAAEPGRLQAWKYETGAEVLNVRSPVGVGGAVFGSYFAATTPVGLVAAGSDLWLRVWDLRTGKEAAKWRLEQAPRGVAVSPDGRTAIVWYEESNKVGLWSLPDLKGKK